MNVDIRKSINSAECIRCGKCISACPSEALSYLYKLGYTGNRENKEK